MKSLRAFLLLTMVSVAISVSNLDSNVGFVWDCDGGGMKVVKDQKTLWEKDWRSVQAAVSTACAAEK